MIRILTGCLALSFVAAAHAAWAADQGWRAPGPGEAGYMESLVSSMRSPNEGSAYRAIQTPIVLRGPLERSQTDAQLAAGFVRGQAIDALLSPFDEGGAAGRVTAFALKVSSGEAVDWFDIASVALGQTFQTSLLAAKVLFTPSEIAKDVDVGGPKASWKVYAPDPVDTRVWDFEHRARELQELDRLEIERIDRYEKWRGIAEGPVMVAAGSRTLPHASEELWRGQSGAQCTRPDPG